MPKPNGFMVFVRHRQLESTRKGNPIESLKEAVELFGKEWTDMKAVDRKFFEDKAKRFQRHDGKEVPEFPVDSPVVNDPTSSENTNHKQFSFVNSLLEESNPTNVVFVVMSCNYFCHMRSNPYVYVPAEIGMCAFSLKLGVIDNYWTLLDPQCLPKGKLLEGRESHEFHKIPLPPFEQRFQDLGRIHLNISHFLKRYKPQNQDWTNIFCVPSDIRIIEGCLNWLVESVEAPDSPDVELKFKMQQLPCLIYKLNLISLQDPLERTRRNWLCKLVKPMGPNEGKKLRFSNIGQCSDFLETTKRNFEMGLSCPYHEKVVPHSMHHCSLGIANRFAMNTLEVLAPRFRISVKPGFHVPSESPEDQMNKRNAFLIRWGYLLEFLDYPDADSDDDEPTSILQCFRCNNKHNLILEHDSTVIVRPLKITFPEEEASFAPEPTPEDTGTSIMIAEVKQATDLFEVLGSEIPPCQNKIYDISCFESDIDFEDCDSAYILGGEIHRHHIEMHGYNWSDFFW